MALVPAKCTQCGGQIEVDDTQEAGICKHCGMAFITEKVIKNYTTVHNVTNNITKIINGNEGDSEEELFERALAHQKIGNNAEANACFIELTDKYPNVAKYHLHYAIQSLDIASNLLDLFIENPTYSISYQEIDRFFKSATNQDLKDFAKEYGIEYSEKPKAVENAFYQKIKDEFINNRLIPAYKNQTLEKLWGDEYFDKKVYEGVLKRLDKEDISKIKKSAISAFKSYEKKLEHIELLQEEASLFNKTLSEENDAKLTNYREIVEAMTKLHEKYELVDYDVKEQKAELKKLEEELEIENAKKEKKKGLISEVLLMIFISLLVCVAIYLPTFLINYGKLGKVENRLSITIEKTWLVALVSFFAWPIIRGIYEIYAEISFKIWRKRNRKKRESEKNKPKTARQRAEESLKNKIGVQAFNSMNKDKKKQMIELEMKKLSKKK